MAFSQATISNIQLSRDGQEMLVSWTCSDADPVTFQVYVDGVLVWSGPARSVHLPWPAGRARIGVGTVGAGEADIDFSSSLPAAVDPFKTLTWQGGTFEGLDISGFRVYGSAVAGGGVDFTNVLATIPAYPGGVVTSGYGLGGYGRGGYGRSASNYSWRTPSLANGSWTFAVAAYDTAGNQSGSPATVVVVIAAAPRPPAASASGTRLSYAYNPTTHVATLNWAASPS